MKRSKLRSNGFGSVEQKVILNVPAELKDKILQLGSFSDNEHSHEGLSLASVVWTRWTTKPGDDESIVWDLRTILGTDFDQCSIDWSLSKWE